jgi:outer membrane receptor protein involved in Fe transport
MWSPLPDRRPGRIALAACVAWVAVGWCFPPSASAQKEEVPESIGDMVELNLQSLIEGVIISAAKTSQNADRSPVAVTVITADDIRAWGYRSIEELLRHVVGFYVVDDHMVANTAIRGVSGGPRSESGLLKVMIDGHSTAYRSTAGNWLGPELIPLSAIDHVEIIRGPVSSLYGADAFLGVINVVTRSGALMLSEASVEANRASHQVNGGFDAAFAASGARWDLLVSLRRHGEDLSGLPMPASSPAPTLLPGVSDTHDSTDLGQQSNVAFIKATINPRRDLEVVTTGQLSMIERGGEFADWTQLSNGPEAGVQGGTRIALASGFADVKATATPARQLKVSLDALAFAGQPTARDRIEVGSDLYYVRRQARYAGYTLESEAVWQPFENLDVVAGANMTFERHQRPVVLHVLKSAIGDMPAGEVQNATPGQTGYVSLSNPGARLQTTWTAFPWVSVTGGLRYDHHNIYGNQLSGRAGAVFELARRLHLKALYGTAFKAPSPLLLYGVPLSVGDIAGNARLRPSYVRTVEGQAIYWPVGELSITSGVALSDLHDMAEFSQEGIGQVARNVSRVRSLSWENEVRLELPEHLQVYGNCTLTSARRVLGQEGYAGWLIGKDNVVFPGVLANLGVLAVIPHLPVRAGVEASFASARRASETNILQAGVPYQLPAYVMLDATLASAGWQVLRGRDTSVQLIVRNVLDRNAADPGFAGVDYPLLRRRVMLQLRQQF